MCVAGICHVFSYCSITDFSPASPQAHTLIMSFTLPLCLSVTLCIPIMSPHSYMALHRGDGEQDGLSKRKSEKEEECGYHIVLL